MCFAVNKRLKRDFCNFSFVNPSSRLSLERTKPILEISLDWYVWREAWISSMILFSLDFDPLLIISNYDFESVSKCMGTARISACSIWYLSATASSNRSANAITSADSTERVTLLDL